jgi:SRSO17 transposase
LLVRRRLSDGELAFYACFGPARTSLAELVRVAGIRWAVEDCFQAAKDQVGLDHYQVRRWDGWYRHMERHEALWDRVEVRDLRRCLVAAGRLKLGAA